MKSKKINHKKKNLGLKHSEETLWQKQAFWPHRKAKRTYETLSNLLVMDTQRMPKNIYQGLSRMKMKKSSK